jgi:hypothetical protein
VRKSEDNRPPGRLCIDGRMIIKMDLKDVGGGGVDWINLYQYMDKWWALVNMEMNHFAPQHAQNFMAT